MPNARARKFLAYALIAVPIVFGIYDGYLEPTPTKSLLRSTRDCFEAVVEDRKKLPPILARLRRHTRNELFLEVGDGIEAAYER